MVEYRKWDGWNRCETDVIDHDIDAELILDAV